MSEPRICVKCEERETGPGGMLCPECRQAIEDSNRRNWSGEELEAD